MNRILVVHRDRQALDGLEKPLLNRADHQITLAETKVQCFGVAELFAMRSVAWPDVF